MVGLAKYRRSLGLPASVIHLRPVAGIGYMARNADPKCARLLDDSIHKRAVYPISEQDLHQIFAELCSPAQLTLVSIPRS